MQGNAGGTIWQEGQPTASQVTHCTHCHLHVVETSLDHEQLHASSHTKADPSQLDKPGPGKRHGVAVDVTDEAVVLHLIGKSWHQTERTG